MGILAELFLAFARIGLFTFGGGYAMIALIDDMCVEKKKWITHDEMTDIAVIAESTPGPIAINCATYVGYKQRGFAGSVAATVGIVLPSFAIIFLISAFLDHFLEIAWIAAAFRGIRVAVGLLILDAAIKMIAKMPKKLFPRAMAAGGTAAMLLTDIFSLRLSSIALMLFAAAIGVAVFVADRSRGRAGEKK